MSIVYAGHITRQMCRYYPEARFVFGDNHNRTGYGGQAREMRGEPNAIGVMTKWYPRMDRDAFFADNQPMAWDYVNQDLDLVEKAVREGRTVYVPKSGIGTGLSELDVRAPKLFAHIMQRLRDLEHIHGPANTSVL